MSCSGDKIVPQNASAFEGEVQFLGFLPFEEASTNTTLAASLKSNGISIQANLLGG